MVVSLAPKPLHRSFALAEVDCLHIDQQRHGQNEKACDAKLHHHEWNNKSRVLIESIRP